ncbi:MAG: radical SAM protein [Pseudomonadota bacterium]
MARLPSLKKPPAAPQPLYLLAINLTRRCNLACDHCYLDAQTLQRGSVNELSSEEVCTTLDEVARLKTGTMVVLTGGEPLVRRDLEDMINHGANLGLPMVVGTNGTLLTERRVRSLKQAGTLGVGISVDSLDPQYHDRFRGKPGCWAKTMAGIEHCRAQQLTFQIHFSITEHNAHELAAIIDFSRSAGAKVLNVFFMVCTGRGESVTDITPQRYEQVIGELIDAQERFSDLIIRPRCAPYFKRIAHQRRPDSPLNRISGQEGDGCIAGTHYCRITPQGGVTACPYISEEVGNIRKQGLTHTWKHAPTFRSLRRPKLQGKCGSCEYQYLCGGCRARPLAKGGQLMDADPWCYYLPQGGAVIQPLRQDELKEIHWTPEAEARLTRVPSFLRHMVKRRAEAYVTELGAQQITPEHLATLYSRRFGSGGPGRAKE